MDIIQKGMNKMKSNLNPNLTAKVSIACIFFCDPCLADTIDNN